MAFSCNFIDGGVTAAQGFTANGVLNKIKSSRTTNDTALIFSEKVCNAAGVFTQNRVKAECVKLTRDHIANGKAQAVIANSGNANACTGKEGYDNANKEAVAVAAKMNINSDDVLVLSTGVIGQQLPVDKILNGLDKLADGLSKEGHKEARIAIMTTDTQYKEVALETVIGGKSVRMGTMAKGSGMIHINLGTMLGFITTDCAISSQMLEKALRISAAGTYNCVSIDGDTSTNDSLLILANGMAGNAEITSEGADFDAFVEALNALNTQMAKKIAADGEGASRLVTCNVVGADTVENARGLAKAVICSNLVKAAFFGADANWGRILDAMGYSGFFFTPEKTSVSFLSREGAKRYFEDGSQNGGKENSIKVFDHGVPLNFDEDLAKKILTEEAVDILVELEDGSAKGTAWGCDLTYDYVKINGDYRT
ncbi:bifunctional glutamate N-acetyltransferase/amino-acid acetyltransferase ArgJ [Treponema ruminis]|uniref:Arginine biosynthesis bifunctional protein ArgJ n=1 Tax=Treponema ruminis TaxID=744515 RepID=A0A7W8LMG0_9SPIR|nr:bifunctional glutamate N-acetyltransferase/amino-acid acetyltransferase ArgJ [Treponema ruminis]MBB5226474.1 glutamate N-acetyltransferase/amino-acid N-acetyltransferase [Treponema ruminis]QSI02621.1 bifunctional glutamate N-acetyltransferase/amino-acid acetyltransferase ArgJ [Treponema ruminis]